MSRALCQLLLSLALAFGVVTALVAVNPTHFTSIDSGYYLQSAASLLAGRGYVMEQDGLWVWNGTFPIGYPALIAAVCWLTGLPVLWMSKLVNGSALLLFAILWLRRIGPGRTLWLVSIWGLGSFLRILAYTWSETVFLVLLAEWVWALNGFLTAPTQRQNTGLILLSAALFLTRYVGIYLVGVMGLLAGLSALVPRPFHSFLRLTVRPATAGLLTGIAGSCLVIMSAYGWLNYHLSGSLFGGERFMPTEPARVLAGLFTRSIANECLLIRDFLPTGSNQLAWLGVVLQLIWLVLLRRQFRRQATDQTIPLACHPPESPVMLVRLFVFTGGLYVIVLFGMRMVSPFSGPNARLMAPATFCFLMAALFRVGTTPVVWQQKLRPYWLILLLLSWLQLLPQADFDAKLAKVRANTLKISTRHLRIEATEHTHD